MRRSTIAIPIFLLIFGVVISAAQTQPPQCKSETVSIPFLTKHDGGWDVSFAKDAKVVKSSSYILGNGEDSGLQYIEYDVRKQVITLPGIEVDPCSHKGTIREWHFVPMQVVGFQKDGHLFAYRMRVRLVAGTLIDSPGLGADTHVTFYAMRGDGLFDSVRIFDGGTGMPLVPDWVEKAHNVSIHPPR